MKNKKRINKLEKRIEKLEKVTPTECETFEGVNPIIAAIAFSTKYGSQVELPSADYYRQKYRSLHSLNS